MLLIWVMKLVGELKFQEAFSAIDWVMKLVGGAKIPGKLKCY